MTHKDFSWWLEGFLTGKEKLDKGEIGSILVMLRDVVEETKLQTFPPSGPIPRSPIETVPMQPPFPSFTPTCKDGVYGPGNNNYGRDELEKESQIGPGRVR